MRIRLSRGVFEPGRMVDGVNVAVVFSDTGSPLMIITQVEGQVVTFDAMNDKENFFKTLDLLGIKDDTNYVVTRLPNR